MWFFPFPFYVKIIIFSLNIQSFDVGIDFIITNCIIK